MNKENRSMMNELHLKKMCELYPSFPKHYHIPYDKKDTSTNGLTRCVLDFINLSGWQAERISSTGRWIKDGEKQIDFYTGKVTSSGGRYIKGSGTKGTADISATIKGRSVKIEVKYGKDRMSQEQKKYKESIERAGGIYMIARNFDDWYNEYKTLFENETI
jgi:hypothetical protein